MLPSKRGCVRFLTISWFRNHSIYLSESNLRRQFHCHSGGFIGEGCFTMSVPLIAPSTSFQSCGGPEALSLLLAVL